MVATRCSVTTDVELTGVAAVTRVDYDVPSITTVGRHWVHGTARSHAVGRRAVAGVRQARPVLAPLPVLRRSCPRRSRRWPRRRCRGASRRSSTGPTWPTACPRGCRMPRALGVFDLEPEAAAIWLPEVAHTPVAWTAARYEHAAFLLGRFAGEPGVAEVADVGASPWSVLDYVHGRLTDDVVPPVLGEEAWQQPGVAEAFDPDLRYRMRDGAERVAELADELAACRGPPPTATPAPTTCCRRPAGGPRAHRLRVLHDPARRLRPRPARRRRDPAGPRAPRPRRASTRPAWRRTRGGWPTRASTVDEDVLRRAHALQLFLFAGVSALPGRELDAGRAAAAARRAGAAQPRPARRRPSRRPAEPVRTGRGPGRAGACRASRPRRP